MTSERRSECSTESIIIKIFEFNPKNTNSTAILSINERKYVKKKEYNCVSLLGLTRMVREECTLRLNGMFKVYKLVELEY